MRERQQKLGLIWNLGTVFSLAGLLLCTTGCGETLGSVSGKVTLKGQPLKGAMVSFSNLDTGMSRETKVKDDGTYEVKILQGMGLPPGKYQVAVHPHFTHIPPPIGPDGKIQSSNQIDHIPKKYRNYKTSGWEINLTAEGIVYNIDVPEK